jgi:hypothetical protein
MGWTISLLKLLSTSLVYADLLPDHPSPLGGKERMLRVKRKSDLTSNLHDWRRQTILSAALGRVIQIW